MLQEPRHDVNLLFEDFTISSYFSAVIQNCNFTPEEKWEFYQKIAAAQLSAWRKGAGYFYWSYKLLLDTANEPEWIGWDSWDLGKCADLGWFPTAD